MNKKYFISLADRITKRLIRQLARFSNWLNRKSNENPYLLDDLSPIDNVENGEAYFKSLSWALRNDDIQNIAITGPYGSGKSSVIRSFVKAHPEYEYLKISLASFREGANDLGSGQPKNKVTADEQRLVEISILQQIFYKVKAGTIPDSRFKRIRRLTAFQLSGYILLIIAVTLSLLVLLQPSFYQQFAFWNNLFKDTQKEYIQYGAGTVCLVGISLLSFYLIRLFNSRQFEKLNISSGEIAIHSDNEKSILNKHLDEILYFFEVTPYNVVIIEDLDRFKDHEIFTKLREINFLLNNSSQVNRKIVFIYALKDDMFLDKTRTKFFEFIMPVIPVVNWSNSYSILLNKLKAKELNLRIDENFVRDITFYIDDMRILNNIFNEFIIYKESLRDVGLDHNKLLGIIVYKNIYPTDFAMLHENKGVVFAVFQQLKEVKSSMAEKIEKSISNFQLLLEKSKTEALKNANELRALYILAIFSLIENSRNVRVAGNWRPPNSLYDETIFDQLRKESRIDIQDGYSSSNTGKKFSDIEKIVDPYQSYESRLLAIENKREANQQKMQAEIASLNLQKNQIGSYSLKELLDTFPDAINSFSKEFLDQKLLTYLLREGYIDEMYTMLTSYFYEGSLTRQDRDFILSVKNQTALDFGFPLTKLDEILKSITLMELRRDAVLNYAFFNHLLHYPEKYKTESVTLFSQFKEKSARHLDFLIAYLDHGANAGNFIASICQHWAGFWDTVVENRNLSLDKKDQILRLIIINSDLNRLSVLNKNGRMTNYVSGRREFLFLIPEAEFQDKVKSALDKIKPTFEEVLYSDEVAGLFDHIYEQDMYSINPGMLSMMIKIKGNNEISSEELTTKPYTSLLASACDHLIKYIEENIDDYISEVYLPLENNINEPEESLLTLLTHKGISLENKAKIIEKVSTLLTDIDAVPATLWNNLFQHRRLAANWNNVLRFYKNEGSINITLAGYLNDPSVYPILGKEIIMVEDGVSEDEDSISDSEVEKLGLDLIQKPIISDESFEYYVKSLTNDYDTNLDFSQISNRKILLLINSGRLILTKESFRLLRQRPEMLIALVQKNMALFLREAGNFSMTEKDVLLLLREPGIDSSAKSYIIHVISDELITDHEELADGICLFAYQTGSAIGFEKLKKVILYSRYTLEKSALVLNSIRAWSIEQVDEVLTLLGEPYAAIAERGKRPAIPLNPVNQELAQRLHELGYISSYKVEKEESRIRINTKVIENG